MKNTNYYIKKLVQETKNSAINYGIGKIYQNLLNNVQKTEKS